MTTTVSKDRGHLWPIVFAVVGGLSIVDYFYKYSFHPDDLLKGLGFLLMVPLAYLYPSAHSFRPKSAGAHATPWAKYLSYTGLALVIAGFAVQWL